MEWVGRGESRGSVWSVCGGRVEGECCLFSSSNKKVLRETELLKREANVSTIRSKCLSLFYTTYIVAANSTQFTIHIIWLWFLMVILLPVSYLLSTYVNQSHNICELNDNVDPLLVFRRQETAAFKREKDEQEANLVSLCQQT